MRLRLNRPVKLGFELVLLGLLLIQSVQWGLVLREAGIYRGAWWTVRSRVNGSALTYLTPSMYFGGEPVRAGMYRNGGMEGTHLFIFNAFRIGSDPSIVYALVLRMGQMTMVLLGLLSIFSWRIGRVGVRGADRNRTDA